MKYSIGDIVMKQGSSEPYIVAAMKENHNGYDLESGFDYLIKKQHDEGHTEHVFEEDIDSLDSI